MHSENGRLPLNFVILCFPKKRFLLFHKFPYRTNLFSIFLKFLNLHTDRMHAERGRLPLSSLLKPDSPLELVHVGFLVVDSNLVICKFLFHLMGSEISGVFDTRWIIQFWRRCKDIVVFSFTGYMLIFLFLKMWERRLSYMD